MLVGSPEIRKAHIAATKVRLVCVLDRERTNGHGRAVKARVFELNEGCDRFLINQDGAQLFVAGDEHPHKWCHEAKLPLREREFQIAHHKS
ncbi:hypothetical protein D3C84_1158490 [compost metagenome]